MGWMSALSCIWNQLAQTAAVKQSGQGKTQRGQRKSERREIYRNGNEGEVGGDGWWGLFTDRIIHYFFLLQYFLSLICLLFFKLDPELRPPAESFAQRREEGGGGLRPAAGFTGAPCTEVEGMGGERLWTSALWWMEAETEREQKPREAADDSVSAAEDIALKDTTWGLWEIGFQSGKKSRGFHGRSTSAAQTL